MMMKRRHFITLLLGFSSLSMQPAGYTPSYSTYAGAGE